jgi:hypothetical protein
VRHACSVIGAQQYREMESSSARAPLAREPVNIEAARKVAERETNASDPLMAPEARGERETNTPFPRETAMSMGTWETNMPERETAAIRRDGSRRRQLLENRRGASFLTQGEDSQPRRPAH